MCLEIPDSYSPSEQSTYVSSCPYWYTFADSKGNILSIEIEEYEKEQSLSEHFHKTMTDSDFLEEESVVCEDLEFRNQKIGQIDFTKLKVRLLALTEGGATSLFFCDYLFVHQQFGITIGITKYEVDLDSAEQTEQEMVDMLKSLTFSVVK